MVEAIGSELVYLSPVTEGIKTLVEATQELAELVGLPMLFLIFISKGLLVGKIFPTSVFLPGYVILVNASVESAAIIAVVTAIGYVIGQCVVFYGTRRYGESFITRLPYSAIDPDSPQFERFDEWFHRWGGISLFTSNFVPWIRGLVTIPAATSSYMFPRYLFYTTSSTVVYHLLYVGIALAGLEILSGIAW